jgi:hypothetical protein
MRQQEMKHGLVALEKEAIKETRKNWKQSMRD